MMGFLKNSEKVKKIAKQKEPVPHDDAEEVKKRSQQRRHMTEMMMQHEEFLIIGLTGRVGSGCSEAANIFGLPFDAIELPPIYPGDQGLLNDAERDRRVLYRYAVRHWLKFDIIKVRTIITSFLLGNMKKFCDELSQVLSSTSVDKQDDTNSVWEGICDNIQKELKEKNNSDCNWCKQFEEAENFVNSIHQSSDKKIPSLKIDIDVLAKNIFELDCNNNQSCIFEISKRFSNFYRMADNPDFYAKRTEILKRVDGLLESLSAQVSSKWWELEIFENKEKKNNFEVLEKIEKYFLEQRKSENLTFGSYVLVHDIIPTLSNAIHEFISSKDSAIFTELYQKYGNSIRKNGRVVFDVEVDSSLNSDTFAMPRRMNQFIKSMRHPFDRDFTRPTRIVIDSLKNPFEATYLRERYSAFYLFAISANEDVRIERLMDSRRKNLSRRQINCIDWNEYSHKGAELYKRFLTEERERKLLNNDEQKNENIYDTLQKLGLFTEDEMTFIQKVHAQNSTGVIDDIRRNAYTNKLHQFVLQDVGASIEGADIFISNNHRGDTKNMELRWEIIRNICLIMYPGLLLPTPIERCMQAAFTAKANSGCLSRQVGAVVTDSDYNILSIGWNDVPRCDISCSRKNFIDICKEEDLGAYTEYEIKNKDFRTRIDRIFKKNAKELTGVSIGDILCGLPWRYCFKDTNADHREPMRSRAMHAEEKALARVQESAIGGYLFTTSSPCEMCSKNAKDHKISKIYYIEPYPGISEDQYSGSGDVNNRAKHILFTGAIGRAYTQMYTPIMPYKDVLEFLGVRK